MRETARLSAEWIVGATLVVALDARMPHVVVQGAHKGRPYPHISHTAPEGETV